MSSTRIQHSTAVGFTVISLSDKTVRKILFFEKSKFEKLVHVLYFLDRQTFSKNLVVSKDWPSNTRIQTVHVLHVFSQCLCLLHHMGQ